MGSTLGTRDGAPEEYKAMGSTREQVRTRNWRHTKDTGKDVVCLRDKGQGHPRDAGHGGNRENTVGTRDGDI